MNKAALNQFGTSIIDVAKSIAKDVYPGGKELVNELQSTIAKNISSSPNFTTRQAQNGVQTILQRLDIDDANDILKAVDGKNVDGSIDALRSKLDGKVASEKMDGVIEAMKKEAHREMSTPVDFQSAIKTTHKITEPYHYAKAYYTNPDKRVRNTRIGATAAAVGTVAIGGRYLSGGTLTTDNYGRKDIAGIPFL